MDSICHKLAPRDKPTASPLSNAKSDGSLNAISGSLIQADDWTPELVRHFFDLFYGNRAYKDLCPKPEQLGQPRLAPLSLSNLPTELHIEVIFQVANFYSLCSLFEADLYSKNLILSSRHISLTWIRRDFQARLTRLFVHPLQPTSVPTVLEEKGEVVYCGEARGYIISASTTMSLGNSPSNHVHCPHHRVTDRAQLILRPVVREGGWGDYFHSPPLLDLVQAFMDPGMTAFKADKLPLEMFEAAAPDLLELEDLVQEPASGDGNGMKACFVLESLSESDEEFDQGWLPYNEEEPLSDRWVVAEWSRSGRSVDSVMRQLLRYG